MGAVILIIFIFLKLQEIQIKILRTVYKKPFSRFSPQGAHFASKFPKKD